MVGGGLRLAVVFGSIPAEEASEIKGCGLLGERFEALGAELLLEVGGARENLRGKVTVRAT